MPEDSNTPLDSNSFNGNLDSNVTSLSTLARAVDKLKVNLAHMADVATSTVFYRKTAGTGVPEVQTLATLKTDLGLTGTNSGDVTLAGTPAFLTIAGQVITKVLIALSDMANVATATVFYRKTAGTGAPEVQTLATLKTDLGLTGTNSGDQTITLTGDVTGSGTGSFAATIANDAVTNAKAANMANSTIKGRTTAGTGDPEDMTAAQTLAILKSGIIDWLYPVGSIYSSTLSTNPGTLLGFGTWAAYAAGRVLVGIDSTQTEFDGAEETGGAKTVTLATADIPSHNHTQNAHNHAVTDAGHTHQIYGRDVTVAGATIRVMNAAAAPGAINNNVTNTSTTGLTVDNATPTNQATGGGGAHNNLQPYIVVYMWKRSA